MALTQKLFFLIVYEMNYNFFRWAAGLDVFFVRHFLTREQSYIRKCNVLQCHSFRLSKSKRELVMLCSCVCSSVSCFRKVTCIYLSLQWRNWQQLFFWGGGGRKNRITTRRHKGFFLIFYQG